METTQLGLIFGWAALLSAVATVGTLITGILFFTVNGKFGKANDIASVFQMALMLPVAVAMHLLTRPGNGGLSLLALGVGSIGMVIAAVLQTALVLGAVSFEQTIGQVLLVGVAIGVWLVLANVLALTGGVLGWGLAAFGIAAGIGYVLLAVGFHKGGQQHPLFYAGSFLTVVGYVVWATWLGRLLQAGALGTV